MPTRPSSLVLIIASFITLSAAQASAQCTCEAADAQASLNNSDIVFWGKGKLDDDGDFVFRVSKSFKGTRRKRRHTVVPASECPKTLNSDTYYIVFAKKDEKRSIQVSSCSATTLLPKSPYTATTWSAADQLPYGVSRRTAKGHQRDRERLNDRALDKVRYAARKCDALWKSDDKATLSITVRFDVEPGGKYVAHLLDYRSPTEDGDELTACLNEKLDGKKFRSFKGNAVSVRAQWTLDRLDASFKQEKKRATVIAFKGDSADETTEEDSDD